MKRKTDPAVGQQPPSAPVPVVAIGASSGGLESVIELIGKLPHSTGMAYVFCEHDEPAERDGQASGAAQKKLAEVARMPVSVAREGGEVLPNRVYVLQDPAITLESGPDGGLFFGIQSVTDGSAPDMPIDRFFISLANRGQALAISVLLSGSTSDGTLGTRAIRSAGGLTFAQDDSASYQTMPRAAIVEGLIDRILSPAEMAAELGELSEKLDVFREAAGANAPEKAVNGQSEQVAEPVALPEEGTLDGSPPAAAAQAVVPAPDMENLPGELELLTIIQLIKKATGTDFSQYKITTIRRRMIRRMLLFRLKTLAEYAEHLQSHPNEIRALYDDLLINVTTFFRDPETMDYLKTQLLPRLVKNKSDHEPLRIWVPACSTGQEAYSIAILLLEVLGELSASVTVQLFATDLSESAVAKARLGTYTRGEVMDVSPRRLQRFFTKVDDHYRINKAVRDLCVFAPQNLLKDPPFSRIDFISCRNLLIYLGAQLQRKAIATFHYALNPNGYLLLGNSETVGTSSLFFSTVESTFKLYSRRNDRSLGNGISRSLFDMTVRTVPGLADERNPRPVPGADPQPVKGGGAARGNLGPLTRRTVAAQPINDLDKVVDELLLTKFVPASVVVSQDLDILQFRGAISLFIEPAPGRASLNLLKMARPALTFELRNIIHKAGLENRAVRRSGLEIRVKGEVQYVAIEAIPFRYDGDDQLFLVLFEEVATVLTADGDMTDARNLRIKQLEEELATLRDDMRSVIEEQEAAHEELQSANEEVISSNEELQSINEELETSKEEIESTNEELRTINSELQVRNDQLSEANAFAEAIFSTIREATLVLTPDLRIKSANPIFYSLFGLNESETEGRLIYELANRQWDIPQLRALLTDVATRNMQVQGFELTYSFPEVGEKVLSLNARRVVRNQEAILLAIEDITEHRRSERFLKEREAWFHQIADNAPALIWVAGANGRYTFLNNVWLEFTGQLSDAVIARGLTQMLHPDDRIAYEQTYRKHLREQTPFQAEYRLRRYDGEYHWMLENAQPTFGTDGQFTGFIGTAADMQEQKAHTVELDRLVALRTAELTNVNEQLKSTAEALQGILDSSPAAIVLLKAIRTRQGEISSFEISVANQRFAQMLNLPLELTTELTMGQLSAWLWGGDTLSRLAEVVESGKPYYVEQPTPNGGWMALSVTRQDDGVVISGLDISDLRQSQQQREDLLRQVNRSGSIVSQLALLEQQSRTRGELLRASSHDLRGSLGVVEGAAGLLQLADSDEERAQMLEVLQRNVQEATRLINELLDFSRLEAGQQQIQIARFDAAELLRKLGENVQPIVDRKRLVFQMLGADKLLVDGDALNVFRMAQNLILNALKYTERGSVTLRWGVVDSREWYFSVADTGFGMDQATGERLGVAQASAPTPGGDISDNPVPGTPLSEGIGLQIVRQLCGLLQGQLAVESEPGQGSVFRVVLPQRY